MSSASDRPSGSSKHFLIRYDRETGQTVASTFGDADAALAAYLDAEADPATKGPEADIEVVLIGAESIEDVRHAYPHYFATGTREERGRAMKAQVDIFWPDLQLDLA